MANSLENDNQLERKILQQEQKIRELAIQTETLEREFDQLLAELNVTRKQLNQFISNKDNFTQTNWEEMERQQKELDQKLLLQLRSICDPLKTKKAFEEKRYIQPQWLFVK